MMAKKPIPDSCVGENIKRVMRERKLSSKQVCSALGIPSSSFSQYLNGTTEPRASVLLKIAKHLCVPIATLIEPPDSTPSPDPIQTVLESIETKRFVEIGAYRIVIQREITEKK